MLQSDMKVFSRRGFNHEEITVDQALPLGTDALIAHRPIPPDWQERVW